MKNIFNKIIFLFAISVAIISCEQKELITLNPDANTVVSLSETDLVLASEMEGQDVLTVSWSDPDFGFDAGASYKVLIDFADGDFTEPQTIVVGNNLEKVFKSEELNSKLLSLGALPEVANSIAVKVLIVLSDYSDILSEASIVSITPYTSYLDLTTTWGVVGSATPNSWDGPDVPFYQTGVDNVFNAYAQLVAGEIKFRENNDWTLNYGDDGKKYSACQRGENAYPEPAR